MIRNLFLIGAGSFIGGICRFLCQQLVQKNLPSSIPLGTLGVNVIGCLIIGIIYGFSARVNILSPELKFFAATGFCGGYTTFSSFAYENIIMMQNDQFFNTALYILMSMIIGFGAVYTGMLFTKLI